MLNHAPARRTYLLPLILLMFAGSIVSANPPANPPANPLAGPAATETIKPASIVTTTFNGEIEVPRPTPEEAAVKLLTLSGEETEAIRKVLSKRAAHFDAFVRDHLTLVISLGVVFSAGDTQDKVNTTLDTLAALQPLFANGPLESQLRACLAPDNTREYNRILRDFWNSYAKWKLTTLKDDGKPYTRGEAILEGRFAALQHELTTCFEAFLYSGELTFKLLFNNVNLTPTQRESIATLIQEATDPKTGEIAKDDAGRLIFTVLPKLDQPGQREQFLKNLGKVARGDISVERGGGQGEGDRRQETEDRR
jgi:hypothetical protein